MWLTFSKYFFVSDNLSRHQQGELQRKDRQTERGPSLHNRREQCNQAQAEGTEREVAKSRKIISATQESSVLMFYLRFDVLLVFFYLKFRNIPSNWPWLNLTYISTKQYKMLLRKKLLYVIDQRLRNVYFVQFWSKQW